MEVRRRLAAREADFLQLIRRAVFERSESPYRVLLRAAGCEYGDLARLVERDGLARALDELRERGVYLTIEEFKGRSPVVRGSTRFDVDPRQLRNPLSSVHVRSESSGSRGPRTSVGMDLAFVRDHAANVALFLDARGGLAWRQALWGVPGGVRDARPAAAGRRGSAAGPLVLSDRSPRSRAARALSMERAGPPPGKPRRGGPASGGPVRAARGADGRGHLDGRRAGPGRGAPSVHVPELRGAPLRGGDRGRALAPRCAVLADRRAHHAAAARGDRRGGGGRGRSLRKQRVRRPDRVRVPPSGAPDRAPPARRSERLGSGRNAGRRGRPSASARPAVLLPPRDGAVRAVQRRDRGRGDGRARHLRLSAGRPRLGHDAPRGAELREAHGWRYERPRCRHGRGAGGGPAATIRRRADGLPARRGRGRPGSSALAPPGASPSRRAGLSSGGGDAPGGDRQSGTGWSA